MKNLISYQGWSDIENREFSVKWLRRIPSLEDETQGQAQVNKGLRVAYLKFDLCQVPFLSPLQVSGASPVTPRQATDHWRAAPATMTTASPRAGMLLCLFLGDESSSFRWSQEDLGRAANVGECHFCPFLLLFPLLLESLSFGELLPFLFDAKRHSFPTLES